VYGFTNLHADSAPERYQFAMAWEQNIPLIPAFILVYVSMNLLLLVPLFFARAEDVRILGKRMIFCTLLAGLIFYFFPAPVAFARAQNIPEWQGAYDFLYHYDHPNNSLPSLHITYSLLAIFSFWDRLQLRGKTILLIWFFLICCSVLFTHQHQVLDIGAGVLLSYFSTLVFKAQASR